MLVCLWVFLSVFSVPLWRLPHLLRTSWCVASSASKSTQIENEQHPLWPQTWSRSAVGEQTILQDRAGRTDPCDNTSLPSNSLHLSGLLHKWWEKWVTSSAAPPELCRLLRAPCLHKACCGTYSTVMPCLAVHAVLSLWMLFLGVHYSCAASAWELLSKWGEMGRDENPESVEQWDVGFKSCMAISKDFYSWCRARYIWGVSSIELENNSKSRFVGVGGWGRNPTL